MMYMAYNQCCDFRGELVEMKNASVDFKADLSGLAGDEWLDKFEDLAEDYGYFEPLGRDHSAAFIDAGTTLLVSFDTLENAMTNGPMNLPFGFDFVASHGWSQLTLLSHGDTWFRDPWVYRFFDRLIDDDFFEGYDRVVFYGAKAAGYAAAAFSVAAPGSTVVAIAPQATLSPDVTGWDKRFRKHRRKDFTSRFGYAPDMVEAADQVFVVYDPQERLDAMHASMFNCSNVTKFTTRFLGKKIESELRGYGIIPQMLEMAANDTLNTEKFATLWRARRRRHVYLRGLLNWCDFQERDHLSEMLCRVVISENDNRPYFEKRLEELTLPRVENKQSA